MAEIGPVVGGLTVGDVRAWLVGRVACYLGEPAGTVDPGAPFASYGLDSVYAFRLCGEIEDALGVAVEPAVLWDVENLVDLAGRIAGLAGRAPRRLPGRGRRGRRLSRPADRGRRGRAGSGVWLCSSASRSMESGSDGFFRA